MRVNLSPLAAVYGKCHVPDYPGFDFIAKSKCYSSWGNVTSVMCEVSPWPQGCDTESSRMTARPRHDVVEFRPLWSSNTSHQCTDTIVGMSWTLFHSQDLLLPCNTITVRISCDFPTKQSDQRPHRAILLCLLATLSQRAKLPTALAPTDRLLLSIPWAGG